MSVLTQNKPTPEFRWFVYSMVKVSSLVLVLVPYCRHYLQAGVGEFDGSWSRGTGDTLLPSHLSSLPADSSSPVSSRTVAPARLWGEGHAHYYCCYWECSMQRALKPGPPTCCSSLPRTPKPTCRPGPRPHYPPPPPPPPLPCHSPPRCQNSPTPPSPQGGEAEPEDRERKIKTTRSHFQIQLSFHFPN